MGQYLPVVCLLVLAVAVRCAELLRLAAARAAAPVSRAKEAPYECGIVPSREPPERFPVTFYVVAMLFIMFDIELIFIYPFAVDRVFLGSYAFWEMIAFSVVFFAVVRLRRGPWRARLGSGPRRHRRLDLGVSADAHARRARSGASAPRVAWSEAA